MLLSSMTFVKTIKNAHLSLTQHTHTHRMFNTGTQIVSHVYVENTIGIAKQ